MLDGNACLCTGIINETELKDTECDRPCIENHKEFCGGEYAQSYYDTDVKVPGPPTSLHMISSTESSILIRWSAPNQINSLTHYVISANITDKYGSKMISPLAQWIVENSNSTVQYDLINLNSGRYKRNDMRKF